MINCPNCGVKISWKKFKPHFKDSGAILLRNRPLCCYQTKCLCGNEADWNSDYVRDEWLADHPNKKTVQLIG